MGVHRHRSRTIGGVLVQKSLVKLPTEGMAADDELGDLYIAEEDKGIFKYGAEPGDSATARVTLDLGRLRDRPRGRRRGPGDLLTTAATDSDTCSPRARATTVTTCIAAKARTSISGPSRFPTAPSARRANTDGLDVVNMNLGPLYPQGMFVVQHDDLEFKMLRWPDVANALGLAIHTTGDDVRGDCLR